MNPFSKEELLAAQESITSQITEQHKNTDNLIVVGIANGGIAFGKRLKKSLEKSLQKEIGFGVLNAAFHRDDIGWKPIPKAFMRTDIAVDIDDATVILVDDVLYSGRTVRAALNELFDHGRPQKVELAVYIEREGRDLPIEANYFGIKISADKDKKIKLCISEDSPEEDQITIE